MALFKLFKCNKIILQNKRYCPECSQDKQIHARTDEWHILMKRFARY